MEAKGSTLSTRARWVLRIALVIAWASGVAGTVTSGAILAYYHGPVPVRLTRTAPSTSASGSLAPSASVAPSASLAPSASAPAVSSAPAPAPSVSPSRPTLGITEAEAEVMSEAFERFRRTRLPLTAANFVLSLALVVGAARTLGRRNGGREWLRQVCVATALFAGAEYVASRDERSWLAERLPAVRIEHVGHPGLTPEQAEVTGRAGVRLSFLLKLLGHLGLYGGLAIALGRSSVIAELRPDEGSRRSVPPSSTDDDS